MSSFKPEVKVQSVAGDPKLVGQRVVIYGDKTRPLLDGLRGKVVSVARVVSTEARLYTVRLDEPLVLLETDSPQHEVEAEAKRESAYVESKAAQASRSQAPVKPRPISRLGGSAGPKSLACLPT